MKRCKVVWLCTKTCAVDEWSVDVSRREFDLPEAIGAERADVTSSSEVVLVTLSIRVRAGAARLTLEQITPAPEAHQGNAGAIFSRVRRFTWMTTTHFFLAWVPGRYPRHDRKSWRNNAKEAKQHER